MKDKINITSDAITSVSDTCETQIILQRHCDFNRLNGNLLDSSIRKQKKIVLEVLKNLETYTLNNIYFLFVASNTINPNSENKRCVDTINIAMYLVQKFLESKGISKNHVINLDEKLNYDMKIKQTNKFSEPNMFTDKKGYLEFLKEKNNGINQQFWRDFEEDVYKFEREELNAEGPDEIVTRGVYYIKVLQRFSSYFHIKNPNSKLIVWCGTHYDLISPLVKQTIFDYEKSDTINVDYCGGISLEIDKSNNLIANVNGRFFPVDFEDIKQPHRRL